MPGTAVPSPLLTHFQQQQELAAQTAATAMTEMTPPWEATPTDDTPTEPHAFTTKPDALGVF